MPIFFWLGAEVMFYYILTIFLLCYFFRKKCVDPYVFEQVQHEEAAGQIAALSTIRGNLQDDEDKNRFDCKNDAAHQLMLEAGYEYVGSDSKKPANRESENYASWHNDLEDQARKYKKEIGEEATKVILHETVKHAEKEIKKALN